MQEPGSVLRAARLAAGLSQVRLARRAGTSQAAISRIEQGRESPTFARFDQLMLALGRRAVVSSEPLLPPGEVERLRDRSGDPARRLREAAAWSRFAGELERAVGRPAGR